MKKFHHQTSWFLWTFSIEKVFNTIGVLLLLLFTNAYFDISKSSTYFSVELSYVTEACISKREYFSTRLVKIIAFSSLEIHGAYGFLSILSTLNSCNKRLSNFGNISGGYTLGNGIQSFIKMDLPFIFVYTSSRKWEILFRFGKIYIFKLPDLFSSVLKLSSNIDKSYWWKLKKGSSLAKTIL